MARYDFYNTTKWRRIRDYIIKRDGGLCQSCGGKGNIVHHLIEVSDCNIDDANVVWDIDNLQLLCQDCHNNVHHGNGGSVADGLRFDADGELVRVRR